MKRNQKGSALLWALAVIGVLAILIAASLTISYSYYNRALTTNSKRQSYLTAKGVVEDIAENIADGNKEYLALFMDPSKDEYTPLVKEEQKIPLTVTFPSTSTIGEIQESYIRINKIDKSMKGYITIGVIANYSGQEYELKADLKLGNIEGVGDKWQIIRYYQNGEADEIFNNITTGYKVGNQMKEYYDYFITKKAEFGDKFDLAWKELLKYLKADKSWEYVEPSIKAELESINRFDDLLMRKYFASRNENHEFTKFSTEEVKGKDKIIVPKAVTTADGKQEIKNEEISLVAKNFYKKDFYIQPKYSNKYNFSFVYANASKTPSNAGDINLVFNNGSWYYIEEVRLFPTDTPKKLVPTSFDFDDAMTKWDYLVSNYLKESNKIQ